MPNWSYLVLVRFPDGMYLLVEVRLHPSLFRVSSLSNLDRLVCCNSQLSQFAALLHAVQTTRHHLRQYHTHTHKHTHLTALFPGLPMWAGTRKVKPIGILLKQETVSGSGISLATCKSAPSSRQTTTPAPHHSFLQARCPSCRPTNSVKALKATPAPISHKNRSCGVNFLPTAVITANRCSTVPDTLLHKLQSVQNATAQLITGTRRSDHISPVYANSTGYPSESASSSKWHAWFASRCPGRRLSTWPTTAVSCPTDSTRRSLWSADVLTCVVPRTFSSYADRTFAAAGPRLWNSLPVQLRNPDITYRLFRWQLKGHLLREARTRLLTCSATEKTLT